MNEKIIDLRAPNFRKDQMSISGDVNADIQKAHNLFSSGDIFNAVDLFELAHDSYPESATQILSCLWDHYQALPEKNRYWLYQGRAIDFNISEGERVLDIGSGQHPFPFATDLGDFAIDDNDYGRAGVDFKRVAGRQIHECNVEGTNFSDKEFDFLFCSHVLEHVLDPNKACNEIMRIAKRGYLECPTFQKDIWMNTAKISNHHWKVSSQGNKLIFNEYTHKELEGLKNFILMEMHCDPQTEREKAFAALVYLKSRQVNVMFPWNESFECEVHWAPEDGVLSSKGHHTDSTLDSDKTNSCLTQCDTTDTQHP